MKIVCRSQLAKSKTLATGWTTWLRQRSISYEQYCDIVTCSDNCPCQNGSFEGPCQSGSLKSQSPVSFPSSWGTCGIKQNFRDTYLPTGAWLNGDCQISISRSTTISIVVCFFIFWTSWVRPPSSSRRCLGQVHGKFESSGSLRLFPYPASARNNLRTTNIHSLGLEAAVFTRGKIYLLRVAHIVRVWSSTPIVKWRKPFDPIDSLA